MLDLNQNSGDQSQQIIQTIVNTINTELSEPADRMMLKLFLDNYKPEAIAYCAGVSQESVLEVLNRGDDRLRQRLGCDLKTLRIMCTRWKLGLS